MGIFGIGDPESTSSHVEDCFTCHNVSGRQVLKSLGLVQHTQKGIAGDAPQVTDQIFRALLLQAKSIGGNAVINVRLETGSYEKQGSQWQMTYVVAYGDAVVLS